jgi:ABC-type bacteriocin/lantibiotic exporter with double-glycine peptidase domain
MVSLVTIPFKDRFNGFKLVFEFLNKVERRNYRFFIFFNLFFSLMDIVGLFLIGLVGTLSFSILAGGNESATLTIFIGLFNLEGLDEKFLISILSLVALLFFILKSLLFIRQNCKLNLFLAEISVRLSRDLLKKILFSKIQIIQKKSPEEITYALSEGVQFATIGILGSMAAFFTECIFIAFILLILSFYNPFMLLALVVFGVLFFLPSQKFFSQRSEFYSTIRGEGFVNDSSRITDTLNLFREIVLTQKMDFFLNRFEDSRKTSQRSHGLLLWIQNLPRISIEIGTVLVIGVLGLIAIIPGSASSAISFMLVFTVAVTRIAPSILRVQQSLIGITASSAYAKHALFFLNLVGKTEPTLKKVDLTPNFSLEHGLEIELSNVTFSFSESNKEPLFDNLSLAIPKNSLVALVGASGLGKSTFCDLITGFQHPQSGEIFVNGTSLADFLLAFPGFISYLPQDNYLFSGTISENVSLDGTLDSINDERVRAALVDSGMWEFLESRGIGIHDHLQNLDVAFSGGQQQRIGIARALFFKSKLIILDEPTSSLDLDAAKSFLRTLKEISANCTVLIVSHERECLNVASHVIDLSKKSIQLSALG